MELGHFIHLFARLSALAAIYPAIGALATNAQVVSGIVVRRNWAGDIAPNKLPRIAIQGVCGNLFGN
jgi:hypothetical protein